MRVEGGDDGNLSRKERVREVKRKKLKMKMRGVGGGEDAEEFGTFGLDLKIIQRLRWSLGIRRKPHC